MKLYELIARNPHLQYIDAASGKSCRLQDFRSSLDITDQQRLALLYLDNSIAAIEVLLNCLDSRLTIALLSPKLNTAYKQQLEATYAPYYIYDPTREQIQGYTRYNASATISLFRDQENEAGPIHPDIKLLLSTSGTTGSPRFVKLSESNLVQNALSIIDYLPINHRDVTPLNLPVFYSYGLSVFTTNSIAGGAIVCANRDVVQKEFWEDSQRYGYTSIAGVPYVYEMLHRIGFCRKEYPALQYMTQAGGKLSPALVKVFGEYLAARNQQFFVMYGQTEATARMSYMPPQALLQKTGSIGRPVKNGQFLIAPDTQELLYTGPNIFGGYSLNAADLAGFEPLPVLHTGDIAQQDDDGYYYITGRMKRFVKLFGARVNLDEVETILKQETQGGIFACIGVEDQHLLVLHQQPEFNDKAIRRLLSEKLHLHPSAFKVQQVDQFVLTPNGKIDYIAMQEKLLKKAIATA